MESKTMKDFIALLKTGLRPSQPGNFKRVAKYIIGGERKWDEMFLRWKMGVPPIPSTGEYIEAVETLAHLRKVEKADPSVSNIRASIDLALQTLKKLYSLENLDKFGNLPVKETKEFEAIETALDEIVSKLFLEKEAGGTNAKPQLDELVTQLSLDPVSNQDQTGCVTLSTIHQAKGLEWNHVFLTGCHEGKLTFFKNGGKTSPEETQEECRLLYVAITRAKLSLTLTNITDPVRFLKDAPIQHEIY